MNHLIPRTDLADESRELVIGDKEASEIDGVIYTQSTVSGISCQELRVLTDDGAKAIGKPLGTFYTLDIGALVRREDSSFENSCAALSELIARLTQPLSLSTDSTVLVVGLGNRDITPDAIGPKAAAQTLVTSHLKTRMPEDFKAFAPTCVITPGVLGTSGIESFDYIKAVSALVKPQLVIAIDALASRSLSRLCSTVQVTDSGIFPGSGVGNSRPEISAKTLEVPVIAIGVPTVVDLRTVFSDILTKEQFSNAQLFSDSESMIVTPRSIDNLVTTTSRVVAYGLNMSLHPGLTISDVDMLLC